MVPVALHTLQSHIREKRKQPQEVCRSYFAIAVTKSRKSLHKQGILLGVYSFRVLESITILTENMAAGSQPCAKAAVDSSHSDPQIRARKRQILEMAQVF